MAKRVRKRWDLLLDKLIDDHATRSGSCNVVFWCVYAWHILFGLSISNPIASHAPVFLRWMIFIDQYVCHQGYTLSVRYILLRHPPIYAPSLSLTHSLTHSTCFFSLVLVLRRHPSCCKKIVCSPGARQRWCALGLDDHHLPPSPPAPPATDDLVPARPAWLQFGRSNTHSALGSAPIS